MEGGGYTVLLFLLTVLCCLIAVVEGVLDQLPHLAVALRCTAPRLLCMDLAHRCMVHRRHFMMEAELQTMAVWHHSMSLAAEPRDRVLGTPPIPTHLPGNTHFHVPKDCCYSSRYCKWSLQILCIVNIQVYLFEKLKHKENLYLNRV